MCSNEIIIIIACAQAAIVGAAGTGAAIWQGMQGDYTKKERIFLWCVGAVGFEITALLLYALVGG